MTDSSDQEVEELPDAFKRCVVPDRLIEKLEVMSELIAAKGHQYKDAALLEAHHKLWLLTRLLRHDEELSLDDIDV